jgi:hypothetical protein
VDGIDVNLLVASITLHFCRMLPGGVGYRMQGIMTAGRASIHNYLSI